MTLKQALQEPDAKDFIEAMEREVNDHVKRGHWIMVTIQECIEKERASQSFDQY